MKIVLYLFRYVMYFITSRYTKYYRYFSQKKKYRGKLIFNHTNYIGLDSSFEGANMLGKDTVFIGTLGYGSYVGRFCELTANVGRFTSIANEVASNPGIHPITYPYVSTSPMFYSLQRVNGTTFAEEQCFDEYKQPVEIGNDCWIGQKVFLNPGIKIGDGAVVYAGSVVTKDVPPYAIVAGVPATVIKYRYSYEDIEFLTKTQWWNKPLSWLKENHTAINDIKLLKKLLKE